LTFLFIIITVERKQTKLSAATI